MKKFVKFYDEIEAKVLVASLAVTVSLIFSQIIMRAVLNDSLTWSEELARYLFIWQTWMGVSIGLRDNKHIKVELIFKLVKGKSAVLLNILGAVLCVILCVFLVKYGGKIVQNAHMKHTLSSALRMPLWIVYLSLPFSCLVTGLRYLCQIVEDLKQLAAVNP